MKLEVEYMVETLKTVLKPMIEEGSAEYLDVDLTEKLGFSIKKIIYNEETRNLILIAPDRPEKSSLIGKGGWVVGRLREELNLNNIHIDAYSDMIIRIYRMELAMNKIENIIPNMAKSTSLPLKNLKELLMQRINNLGEFNFVTNYESRIKSIKIQ